MCYTWTWGRTVCTVRMRKRQARRRGSEYTEMGNCKSNNGNDSKFVWAPSPWATGNAHLRSPAVPSSRHHDTAGVGGGGGKPRCYYFVVSSGMTRCHRTARTRSFCQARHPRAYVLAPPPLRSPTTGAHGARHWCHANGVMRAVRSRGAPAPFPFHRRHKVSRFTYSPTRAAVRHAGQDARRKTQDARRKTPAMSSASPGKVTLNENESPRDGPAVHHTDSFH